MKKFVIGLIIGLILALPATAFGEQINSLIGKKVQTEYTVSVNDSGLETNAVVIDGIGFVPIREFAAKEGYLVELEGKTIKLTKQVIKLGEPPLETEDRIKEIDEQIKELEKQRADLEAQQIPATN